MCICINCKHLCNCQTYNFIEKQHKTNLKKNKYDIYLNNFIPLNTLIQVNLKRTLNEYILDWDLIECLSFAEKPGSWAIDIKHL